MNDQWWRQALFFVFFLFFFKKKEEKTSPGNWQCASVFMHYFDGLQVLIHSFSSVRYFANLARLRTRVREPVRETDIKICKILRAGTATHICHLFNLQNGSEVGLQKSKLNGWNHFTKRGTWDFKGLKHAEDSSTFCSIDQGQNGY